MAAVPAGHPLTHRKRVTLADIAAHPVVCLPEAPASGRSSITAARRTGCGRTSRGRRAPPDSVADLAARGLGVAILTASMVDDGLRGLEIAELDAPALRARLGRHRRARPARARRNCRSAASASPRSSRAGYEVRWYPSCTGTSWGCLLPMVPQTAGRVADMFVAPASGVGR